MDRKSILSKTAKGLSEATGKTSDLPRDLRNLLKEIDGKVTVGQLQMRQELFTEAKFMDALRSLERDGYVREAAVPKDDPAAPRSPLSRPPEGGAGEDLDFTSIASRTGSRQASDISRQIAQERERAEAAAKAKAEEQSKLAYQSEAKREREEMDRIHREAEERSRKAAEEKARREAEEKAKRDAEERAKREVEERRRREADEKARREAEEKARREAEARAKREAEERARRDAEEKAKREAEEKRRREEEERRRREEEQRRRREEEEREKREASERARREEEKRRAEEEDERRRKEEDRKRWELEAKAEAAELEQQIRLEREARQAKGKEKEKERGGPSPEGSELEAALRAERAETEERLRRENEERVRREEEERRRQEEEARLRPASETDAEDEMQRREDEMRRREKEEAERAKQEAKARAEADAKAAAEARARDKAGQDQQRHSAMAEARSPAARSRRARRAPGNFGKSLSMGLFLILVLAVVVMHFVPIDQGPYEKAAQEWLGQPVRIGAVYVQLVPSPHLRFEKVTIGKDPQMRIAAARAEFAITSLFDERKALRRIELDGATVPQPLLAALVSGAAAPGPSLGTQRVVGKALKLDLSGFSLPDLNVDADLDGRGAVTGVRFTGTDGRLSGTLQPQAGRWSLEFSADKFTLPIGGSLTLDEFSAKGIIGRGEIAFSQVEGRALNGAVQANGRLRWGDGWSLDGEFSVRQMDAAKIAAPVVAGGTLEGKGTYGMRAAAPNKLLEAARMEGNFTVQKGTITNVDMMRILQGSATAGGTTLFNEMSGNATADSGRIQVRGLRFAAGLLQGTGNVDIDSDKNLSGRMQIELRAQTVQARAMMAISGSVDKPQFRRVN